jgi:hypothetical protein
VTAINLASSGEMSLHWDAHGRSNTVPACSYEMRDYCTTHLLAVMREICHQEFSVLTLCVFRWLTKPPRQKKMSHLLLTLWTSLLIHWASTLTSLPAGHMRYHLCCVLRALKSISAESTRVALSLISLFRRYLTGNSTRIRSCKLTMTT